MTPQQNIVSSGMGNQNSAPANPNQLYNSLSSRGLPEQNSEESQEPEKQNPAEQFLEGFKNAFEPIKSLLDNPDYSGASKEGELVKRALEHYMETVVGQLSQAGQQVQQGGELL